MTHKTDWQRPSLLRRLTAILYDAFLVIALIAVANGVALAIVVKASGDGREVLSPLTVQAVTICSTIAFFTLFWLKDGQTLGMQAWRIKLVNNDGGPVTLWRCLLRCMAALLSAACLGLGYLWCLVDRDRRCWHDRLSHTDLILLDKESRTTNPADAAP